MAKKRNAQAQIWVEKHRMSEVMGSNGVAEKRLAELRKRDDEQCAETAMSISEELGYCTERKRSGERRQGNDMTCCELARLCYA